MEDIPPSYYQSMNPSVLDVLAPYLDTLSLHSLTLVSRSYNETFMPHLWGSPASHFVPMAGPTLPGDPNNPQVSGSHDDLVYVALTRFKRTLKKARLSTRCLVHTLFLPPARSEIYGGPNVTWLREILDGLPNLQSLCVGGLPFFDHHSLVAVEKVKRSQNHEDEQQTYPLKLLIASKEENTTSIGLSLFLPRVKNLVYLDLSYTTPARDTNVLSSLCLQTDLQVLKLRGIELRDTEAEVLANAIGLRVRLLDVAENRLSDMAVRSLLQACFQHETTADQVSNGNVPDRSTTLRRQFESWPVSLPPAPDFLSLDTLRSSDLDQNLRVQLTNPLTGRLAFEDIPHAGLTHLYITGNPGITIEGIKSLLATGKLHVLDAGEIAGETVVDKYVRSAIDTGRFMDKPRSSHSASSSIDGGRGGAGRKSSYDADIHFPGAEKLIPVLKEKASKNLTYLRIDHALITKDVEQPVDGDNIARLKHSLKTQQRQDAPVELSGQVGVTQLVEIPGSNRQPAELASDQIFELDATPTVRAELPGDIIHFALTPPMGEKPQEQQRDIEGPKPVRGEGPYAPEVVIDTGPESIPETSSSGSGHKHQPSETSLFSPVSPLSPQAPSSSTNSTKMSDPVSIDAIISAEQSPIQEANRSALVPDRRTKIDSLLRLQPPSDCAWMYPSSLPNLRTLVLTDIPSQVPVDSPILRNLKQFISSCAIESQLSLLRARTDYSLPPGRARYEAERKHARSLFALQTIILELSPATPSVVSPRDWKHTRQRLNISKSSTGDRDSEALWSAAENDFSFFGEEGEEEDECGIYEHEPGKYFPQTISDEKFGITPDDPESSIVGTPLRMYSPGVQQERTQIHVGPTFKSPRELPLGRNRRSSNESQRTSATTPASPHSPGFTINNRLGVAEMMGAIPPSITNNNNNLNNINYNTINLPARSQTLASPTRSPEQTGAPKSIPETIMVDVKEELSKFRKERRSAYEAEVHRQSYTRIQGVTVPIRRLTSNISGAIDLEVFVEGHWKGEIKVDGSKVANQRGPTGGGANNGTSTGSQGIDNNRHRHTLTSDGRGRFQRNGMVDFYGNYFEKDYLYS